MFERLWRKRQRLSGSGFRAGPDEEVLKRRERRLRRLAISLAFVVIVVAVTPRLRPIRENRVYNLDTAAADVDFYLLDTSCLLP